MTLHFDFQAFTPLQFQRLPSKTIPNDPSPRLLPVNSTSSRERIQSRVRSGGGAVESVKIQRETGTAFVTFEDADGKSLCTLLQGLS